MAMSFTQAATVAPSVPSPSSHGQNIELSTLKFADSPSIDDTLKEWFIPPPPFQNNIVPLTGAPVERCTIPSIDVMNTAANTELALSRNVPKNNERCFANNVVGVDCCTNNQLSHAVDNENCDLRRETDHRSACQHRYFALAGNCQPAAGLASPTASSTCGQCGTPGCLPSTYTQTCCSGSTRTHRDAGRASAFDECLDFCSSHPKDQSTDQYIEPDVTIGYEWLNHLADQDCPPPHNAQLGRPVQYGFTSEDVSAERKHFGGVPHSQQPYYHQHQLPQSRHSGYGHPVPQGFNANRRLPDFVTIDQCYSGVDDSDESTICLIANFDAGGSVANAEHRDSHPPVQGHHAVTQGVHAETAPRKERISLRRGIMMRQMSQNPSHEQGLLPVSEGRMGERNQDQECPNSGASSPSDSWDDSHDSNQSLLKCSNVPQATVISRRRSTFVHEEKGCQQPRRHSAIGEVDVLENKGCNINVSNARQPDMRQQQLQQQEKTQKQLVSPSNVKMKMKNLGLSNAASAMRFRLTFDESADAAANNNIDLPSDVNPQVPSTNRTSCICGEPEIPTGLCPYTRITDKSGCDSIDSQVQAHNAASMEIPSITTAPPTPTACYPQGGNASGVSNEIPLYPDAKTQSQGMYNIKTALPLSSSEVEPLLGPEVLTSYPLAKSPLPDIQTSEANFVEESIENSIEGMPTQGYGFAHPKVTICISNSQQSFIPYISNSPTFDGDLEDDSCYAQNNPYHPYYNDHNPNQDPYDNIINNNNSIDYKKNIKNYNSSQQYFKDSSSPVPIASHSPAPYQDSFMVDHTHSDFENNAFIMHGEELREANQHPFHHGDSQSMLLAHHDTVTAPPIQDLYRYHVFFSNCAEDREWVEHMVAHLEAPPFNYSCAYASQQDEEDPATLQQRILCAAMLSERVVLVLSCRYVQDTWFTFEKTLKQLTQMSLHNKRIMGVLLEDCNIPESLGELYFLDSSDPDFFHVFTERLKTSRIPRSSASVSSELGQNALVPSNLTNGKILTFCRLQVKVGWESYLLPADDAKLDLPPSLSAHGIGMEKTEFGEIVTKVSGIVNRSNKLPWLLSAQPMAVLLLAGGLWLPAFIAVLVVHVDDKSGIALPIRLAVFLFPLGLVAAGYLTKWRRSYWLTKIVRLLVQNCVDVNQALYFQGRPLFITAAHVRAKMFAIYFVYFDATDCVRSVDLLLFTCMEEDWEKLIRLITFYTRDENYLSRMSISERLTVMMSAPYLVKLVKQMLPHPPQQRHVSRLLCLCQFTEECISRFAHGLDREDVPGLAELFTRHMSGKVSGSAVRRVQEELLHANHGLVP